MRMIPWIREGVALIWRGLETDRETKVKTVK